MAAARPLIWVVDDDDAMRRSLRFMLDHAGYDVKTAESAEAFFEAWKPGALACLIVDLQLPRANGLELVEQLRATGAQTPVIMLSGHGTIPSAVEAMRLGALDFMEKPVARDRMLERVRQCVAQAEQKQQEWNELAKVRERLATLTPRERELLDLIVAGRSNKQIAGDLHIAEKTVANHRARLMEKMGALNAADLARMVVAASGKG
jgi:FixJ family two-component response regulator